MSMFAALVRAYERLPDAPPFGYADEKIGFCVVLNHDGSVFDIAGLRASDKKRSPRILAVPSSPKRSGSTPRPNFLWDNANYALGIGKLKDPDDMRHDAFREKHLEYLKDVDSAELRAFRSFLESWKPEDAGAYFDLAKPPTEGIVFALVDSYRDHLLHESDEARQLWADERAIWIAVPGKSTAPATCLITGKQSPIERTHPPIKGVWGGKTEMALVSFNSEAYESYGHEQGDNAPVSEAAAFAYTTALNRFLAKDSGHRVQIGDASTVFWADASDAGAAEEAEGWAAFLLGDRAKAGEDEKLAEQKIAARLQRLRAGQPLDQVAPELAQGVRFYVLGLAPNAARLSVRFYWEDEFGSFVRNYQRYMDDMALAPAPRDGWPPLWHYLRELVPAVGRKPLTRQKVEESKMLALIAGEWLRAILTGGPYPLTLMSTVLMRIRADGEVNALRAAMLKSVLIRNFKEGVHMALDPTCEEQGYVLGRLFATYENIQKAALGRNVKATIRDKFYGSASATPARVFGSLASNAFNHLAKIRKEKPGLAQYLQEELQAIADLLDIAKDPFPTSLPQVAQAKFALGYYHQSSFRKHDDKTPEEAEQ